MKFQIFNNKLLINRFDYDEVQKIFMTDMNALELENLTKE